MAMAAALPLAATRQPVLRCNQLTINMVNRHPSLELHGLWQHVAAHCSLPASSILSPNSSHAIAYTVDRSAIVPDGCMAYRLRMSTGNASSTAAYYLLIGWHVSRSAACRCWLDVVEAGYSAFPESQRELRLHYETLAMSSDHEQRKRTIQLPGGVYFSVTAIDSQEGCDTADALGIGLDVTLEASPTTASPIAALPALLIPYDTRLFTPDPAPVGALNMQTTQPALSIRNHHSCVTGQHLHFDMQHATATSTSNPTTVAPGCQCTYPFQPTEKGTVSGGVLLQLTVSPGNTATLELAIFWCISHATRPQMAMLVLASDAELRKDASTRRRLWNIMQKQLAQTPDSYDARTTTSVDGVLCALQVTAHPHYPSVVSITINEAQPHDQPTLPVWFPSDSTPRHHSVAAKHALSHLRATSQIDGVNRQQELILLVENLHDGIKLNFRTHHQITALEDDDTVLQQKQLPILPGQCSVTSSDLSIFSHGRHSYLVYELLDTVAVSYQQHASSGKRSKLNVFKAISSLKSKSTKREMPIPDTPPLRTLLVVGWANNSPSIGYSAELVVTNDGGFPDSRQAPTRYILQALLSLGHRSPGQSLTRRLRMARRSPSTVQNVGQRAIVPRLVHHSVQLDAHLSLDQSPVLSLSVHASADTADATPDLPAPGQLHASPLPEEIHIQIANEYSGYRLIHGRQFTIDAQATISNATVAPHQAARGLFMLSSMAERSFGVCIFEIERIDKQPLRNQPCFLVAWSLTNGDLRFVANVMQETPDGKQGNQYLLELPNLFSLFCRSQATYPPDCDAELTRCVKSWTGLFNMNQVYTVQMQLCVRTTRKLYASITLSGTDANDEVAPSYATPEPTLALSALAPPGIAHKKSSQVSLGGSKEMPSPPRTPDSFGMQNIPGALGSRPGQVYVVVKNRHALLALRHVVDYALCGTNTSRIADIVSYRKNAMFICNPPDQTDVDERANECSGFAVFSVMHTNVPTMSNSVYLIVGWQTRHVENETPTGQFFANIVKVRLKETTRFATAAAADRFYQKLCGGRQIPLGKKIQRHVTFSGQEDGMITSCLVHNSRFILEVSLRSGDKDSMSESSSVQLPQYVGAHPPSGPYSSQGRAHELLSPTARHSASNPLLQVVPELNSYFDDTTRRISRAPSLALSQASTMIISSDTSSIYGSARSPILHSGTNLLSLPRNATAFEDDPRVFAGASTPTLLPALRESMEYESTAQPVDPGHNRPVALQLHNRHPRIQMRLQRCTVWDGVLSPIDMLAPGVIMGVQSSAALSHFGAGARGGLLIYILVGSDGKPLAGHPRLAIGWHYTPQVASPVRLTAFARLAERVVSSATDDSGDQPLSHEQATGLFHWLATGHLVERGGRTDAYLISPSNGEPAQRLELYLHVAGDAQLSVTFGEAAVPAAVH